MTLQQITLQDYKKKSMPELKKKLGLKNIHQVPQVDKVVVSIGIGSLATRKSQKDFTELQDNLAQITGQRARMVLSKKAISNFKLRENMPVMLQVTLRREKAIDFLWRLTTLVLPRVRDFAGLSPKSFDKNGNYNIGLPNYGIFPELKVDDVSTPVGLQVNVTFTSNNIDHNKEALKALGFIIKE